MKMIQIGSGVYVNIEKITTINTKICNGEIRVSIQGDRQDYYCERGYIKDFLEAVGG